LWFLHNLRRFRSVDIGIKRAAVQLRVLELGLTFKVNKSIRSMNKAAEHAGDNNAQQASIQFT